MDKYFSGVSGRLLGVLHRASDVVCGRVDLSDVSEFLQVSVLGLPVDRCVLPHRHVVNVRLCEVTQECWVVVSGALCVVVFDVDDSFVGSFVVGVGDVYVSFGGGHSVRVLVEGTRFVEVKNGPYFGRDLDVVSF